MDELMALVDRTLSDIGLSRGSIEHAVRYGGLPATLHDGIRQ
jgi:hypothetical protein